MRTFAEDHHGLDAVAGQPLLPGAAGMVLMLAAALVAGAGLVRPLSGPPGVRARRVIWSAAAVTGLGMIVYGHGTLLVTAHAVFVLVAALLLPRRLGGPLAALPLTALLAVEAPFAPAYTVAAVLALGAAFAMATRTAPPHRLAAVAASAVLVAGGFTAVEALRPTPEPPAGVPRLVDVHLAGDHLPVLVAPGRPGPNLVLLGHDEPVLAGTDPAALVPSSSRPGATGQWAPLDLPPGPSTLWLERAGQRVAVGIDAGHGPRSPATVTGPDGPECASAALGLALAGGAAALAQCPSDTLAGADEASLRDLVAFLAARKVSTLTLSADSSPRSAAAATAVRQAAAASGLAVTDSSTPDGALVVVSGWSAAAALLTAPRPAVTNSAGTYLAPWLLSAPVVAAAPGAVVPLRFDPRDPEPVQYELAVAALHTQTPTASGYHQWLAAKGITTPATTRLYATAPISLLPQQFTHHTHNPTWLPGGTIVPITGPLAREPG